MLFFPLKFEFPWYKSLSVCWVLFLDVYFSFGFLCLFLFHKKRRAALSFHAYPSNWIPTICLCWWNHRLWKLNAHTTLSLIDWVLVLISLFTGVAYISTFYNISGLVTPPFSAWTNCWLQYLFVCWRKICGLLWKPHATALLSIRLISG